MKTKQLYTTIDNHYTSKLKEHGLAYNLRKIRYCQAWIVNIGKFNSITDPYIKGEIYESYSINEINQFSSILQIAIDDNLVNYG